MDKNLETQKLIENDMRFFFDNITKELTETVKSGKLNYDLHIIEEQLRGCDYKALDTDQFKLIGQLSYLVGLDFSSQQFCNEKVCDIVRTRFGSIVTDLDSILTFVEIIKVLEEKDIIDAKESMKLEVLGVVSETDFTLKDCDDLEQLAKNVFDNSEFPVSFAIEVINIFSKPLTYDGFLKINSMIRKQLSITGETMKTDLLSLFENKKFEQILTIASEKFDRQKFAVLYLDSVLSTCEANKKFNDILADVLTPGSIIDFVGISETFHEKSAGELKPEVTEDKPKDALVTSDGVKLDDLTPEQLKEYFNLNCDLILKDTILTDTVKFGYVGTNEDCTPEQTLFDKMMFVKDIEGILQNIYMFIKNSMTNPNHKGWDAIFADYDKEAFMVLFNAKEAELKAELKSASVKLFSDIESDKKDEMVKLINETICALRVNDADDKMFLMSQLVENGIETYNHLQQIISLIENQNINGKLCHTYVDLHKFLTEKTDISAVFELGNTMEESRIALQYMLSVKTWLFPKVKSTEKSEPKMEVVKGPDVIEEA